MRGIKLMPDYDCFPLWEASPGSVGNIDPNTLPLSNALRSRLETWADRFDATLNRDDPGSSGFSTQVEKENFRREGYALVEALREELGDKYSITVNLGVLG